MRLLLVPETVTAQGGTGAPVSLDSSAGKALILTLDITQIFEDEMLDVAVWGSADGQHWRQLTSYSQKFYCGTYLQGLDLIRYPQVRYLRAQWGITRWGWGSADRSVRAGFILTAESIGALPARQAAKLQEAGNF